MLRNNDYKNSNISVLTFEYDTNIINNASKNGQIDVLEWVHNSKYEFIYNEEAINSASMNGRIDVLEWFHKNKNKY